mmetsp:Transcript_61192/g.126358  ORF Transcript_61192/g.126358 Transcript_61192/m.126358 type:complete len:133 (+) Transcript_61192:3228-3626(+)
MESFINNQLSPRLIDPLEHLVELEEAIALASAEPDQILHLGHGDFPIAELRDQREDIRVQFRNSLPQDINIYCQLCYWLREIYREQCSFREVLEFLSQWEPTQANPVKPTIQEFTCYKLKRKFLNSRNNVQT